MFNIFKKEGVCESAVEEVSNDGKITIDDFAKVEIKAGKILSAEKVEDADRLLKLEVCFGDHKRQIVSGIAEHYPNPEDLVGTVCPFVTNLAPRTLRGLESNGMIMAVGGKNDVPFSLLKINDDVTPGTRIS
jgi:methionine--tRNA ligase beta chain